MLEFSHIYFVGNLAVRDKIQGLPHTPNNNGYDDERGDYKLQMGDHLEYRYEVLSLLGKGSFGQVVKCFDHKKDMLVALKMIRNKKRFHHQALVEVKILEHLMAVDKEHRSNIVRVHGYFYFRNHLCIAFEPLSINLYEFIKNNHFQGLSLGLIRRFAIQLLTSLAFLAQQRIIHCFPESDTRLLTDHGFLFLDQIEQRLARGERVMYACFERSGGRDEPSDEQGMRGRLVYCNGTLLLPHEPSVDNPFPPPPPTSLVELASDQSERGRWSSERRSAPPLVDEGGTTQSESSESKERVSLRFTPNHRLFAQRGAWNGRSVEWRRQPPSLVDASSLLSSASCGARCSKDCKHSRAYIRTLACAEAGLTPTEQLLAHTHLRLRCRLKLSDTELDAFLELLGFWLKYGMMAYRTKAVQFRLPHSPAHVAFLTEYVSKAGLGAQHYVFERRELERGSKQSKLLTLLSITEPHWFRFFDDEFGPQPRQSSQPTHQQHSSPAFTSRSHSISTATMTLSTCSDHLSYASTDDEALPLPSSISSSSIARPLAEFTIECGTTEERGWTDVPSCPTSTSSPMASLSQASFHPSSPTFHPSSVSLSEADVSDPDNPLQSARDLPVWLLSGLLPTQLRLVVQGLWRAEGSRQPPQSSPHITASGAASRDQLLHALLLCGFSAYPKLVYTAGTVCGYTWHELTEDNTVYEVEYVRRLSEREQGSYRPLVARADKWHIEWADASSGTEARRLCWPSMQLQPSMRSQAYDRQRDGRIWCVNVQHSEHVIVAQRALRTPAGVMTVQSRPVLIGNCDLKVSQLSKHS